jgi:hypothetical protein
LGEIYFEEQNISEAERLFLLSFNVFRTNQDTPNHPDRYLSLKSLATLYEHKAEEARKLGGVRDVIKFKQQANAYLRKALAITEAIFLKNSSHIKRIRQRLRQID